MFRGTVSFRAAFPGVEFDPIEIVCRGAIASRATLKSSASDGFSLRVEVTEATSVEAALEAAREVAAYVARVLTFQFGVFYHSFGLCEYAVVEEQTGSDGTSPLHHLGSSIGFTARADVWKALGPAKQAELKTALEQPHHSGFVYYDLFRSALSLDDALSKFMAIYNIVLLLNNDSQEEVDTFAFSVQPGIATNSPFRPRRSGMPETIYTRLRNQVGHVRPGTTIEQTRTEMQNNLTGLIQLAQELIRRQP